MTSTVSFVDLRAQHAQVRGQIEAAIDEILDRSAFIGGDWLKRFEAEFAAYLGSAHVLGVANGTDALWLVLRALGVGPGDAVITVPNTFIATVEAITRTGAQPIFIDIDLATANIDVAAVDRLLREECKRDGGGRLVHQASGRRVAALLPVHLYGLPADMESLGEIARGFGLPVVEDACQAHGARCRAGGEWKRVGNIGDAAGFSFYPAKNLGALGDGGAVSTSRQDLAETIRCLRDHGQKERYIHSSAEGWNSRLDGLQAAVLAIKLAHLDEWNAARRKAAALYRQALVGLPLELPFEPEYAEHVYHLYVVRTPERDRLRKGLDKRGIGTGLHYPIPLHLQEAYRHLGLGPGAFHNAERSAATGLSLPMHQSLTEAHIEQVADACRQVLG